MKERCHPSRPLEVELALPVRTYDIDFAGVVSNIVYIRWLEDLRLKLLEEHLPLKEQWKQDVVPVLVWRDRARKEWNRGNIRNEGCISCHVFLVFLVFLASWWFVPFRAFAGFRAFALPVRPSPADLVEVRRIVPGICVDLRYATTQNVFGRRLYTHPRCLLRRAVAERLGRVQRRVARDGYGLNIWDAYRPRSVQRVMWRIHPRGGYVGDPRHGSFHNRGVAVDLTLVRADGRPVPMPSAFDDFSPHAHLDYPHLSPAVRKNRARLLRAMRAEGFIPYRREWWHYVAPDYRRYPMLDVPL